MSGSGYGHSMNGVNIAVRAATCCGFPFCGEVLLSYSMIHFLPPSALQNYRVISQKKEGNGGQGQYRSPFDWQQEVGEKHEANGRAALCYTTAMVPLCVCCTP